MIVKLLSYNIRFGGRGRERELAEVIRSVSPDLVVLQEATDPEVISRLAATTGMPVWSARREHSIGYLSRLGDKPSRMALSRRRQAFVSRNCLKRYRGAEFSVCTSVRCFPSGASAAACARFALC